MDERLREVLYASDNIVFFGGAGVSTESGIPDFRSENGLYKARNEFGYAPEQIISHTFFMQRTDIFYKYYKENMICPEAKPNKAHYALARLEEEGRLRAVITQNIDGLHQAAGSKNVIELHGSVHRNYCMKCGKFYGLDHILKAEGVPRCSCGGIIKPDVVLYEESLDGDAISNACDAIAAADVLIIGGTSLAVYPAAGFIHLYRGDKLILINMSETPMDSLASMVFRDPIGKVLGD